MLVGVGRSIALETHSPSPVVPMLVGVGRYMDDRETNVEQLSPCSWGWAGYPAETDAGA